MMRLFVFLICAPGRTMFRAHRVRTPVTQIVRSYATGGAREVSKERKESGWPWRRLSWRTCTIGTSSAAVMMGACPKYAETCGSARLSARRDRSATLNRRTSARRRRAGFILE